MPDLVKAFDTVTRRKVAVPAHFLGPKSPFPNLKKLPSERSSDGKEPATNPDAGKTRRASGSTTNAPAKGAAATDKEK